MSGALNLSSYQHIQQTSFVKLNVPGYGLLRMSNFDRPFNVDEINQGVAGSYTYTPMGTILAISEFNNELRPSNTDVTISLAAIDQAFIPAMMGYSIKGSQVEIRRAFFDALTGQLLDIPGNPSLRFTGVVANYNFSDTVNDFTQSNTTTINVSCSSIVKVLQNKIAGQTTNDAIRKSLYPGDKSFERVATIATSNFNFGAPV
jgi:hypothetical protein